MFARRLALVTGLLALACADTDHIDTGLQRDPPRGAVRVVSLVPDDAVALSITLEDEAPVSFAGLGVGVTGWRTQVAGEATGWVLKDGSPLSSAPLVLDPEAQVSALVSTGGATPRVTWLVETFGPGTGPRVRFINGLEAATLAASVDGQTIGGQVDPATATAWFDVDEAAHAELLIEAGGSPHSYGPIAFEKGVFITLAAFPGPTGEAAPRLLVFQDPVENAAPAATVLEASTTP